MSDPLVAAAPGSGPSPWAGFWVAEDIDQIVQGVRAGSWIDGTLGTVSAGLDALAFVSDPIGSLLQCLLIGTVRTMVRDAIATAVSSTDSVGVDRHGPLGQVPAIKDNGTHNLLFF